MRWNLVIGLIALITLVGCTPTIDTSSEERMEESVKEIRDSLSGSDLDEFDEAMMTLAFSSIGEDLFDPDLDEDEMERRMLAALDGKNAREVVAEAEDVREQVAEKEAKREMERHERERTQALQEIEELEEAKADAEQARSSLEKFTIERSRFRKVEQRFGRAKPEIQLEVTNNTEHAVSRAYFDGRLATPGRSVAWLEETFNYSIAGGLEPGESAEWNLAPNTFSDWGQVEERDDMVFTVTTTRLDGADGEPLFVDDFGEREANRLETLRAEFGE